jgi:CDP-glucose 4,6-dehydratase
LIPDAVRSFAARRVLAVRNPAAVRPWQHVLDAAAGILAVAEALRTDGVAAAGGWNIGPDPADIWPVGRLADRFAALWGDGAGWQRANPNEPQPYEAGTLTLDSRRAHDRLGWQPRLPLDAALAFTAEWYKAYYAGADVAQLSRTQIGAVRNP